jgi:hypothetical protein
MKKPIVRRRLRRFNYVLEGNIKGAALNFARKNYWRVKHLMDWEDYWQEIEILFLLVKDKYRFKVKNQAHFMALFLSTLRNWTSRVATQRVGEKRTVTLSSMVMEQDEGSSEEELLDAITRRYEPCVGEFAVKMSEAPKEILSFLNLLMNLPKEFLSIFEGNRRNGLPSREEMELMMGEKLDFNAVKDYLKEDK